MTIPKNRVKVARLLEVLDCDAANGQLTWKPKRLGRYGGRTAGYDYPEGYTMVNIDGAKVPAHRIIWAMHTGAWPVGMLDHINGIRNDNRICNLRECTDAQNQMNRRPKTGVKGVTLLPSGKWQSQIKYDGKSRYLGCFADKKSAIDAYNAAAKVNFGEFAHLSPAAA